MARPSRSAMYADDGTFLWKAILRFLAILLALVGIGTTAWAMVSHIRGPSSNDNDSYSYGDDDSYLSYGFLPWQYITLGASVLWNVANISTLVARNRFIHPGANVACDLLLWLGLLITGGIATFGSTNYLYYSAYDGDSYYEGSGYGGGTYSNGTRWEYTANGTVIVPTTNDCGGFATCAARDQYVSAVQHKGVVVAVGASMAFVVLLIHFALFISACRYTHNRRHSTSSKQARAITAEATEIARRMIADMTGPNGGFIPRGQTQHHGGTYEPLQQSEAGESLEMRQRRQQSGTQPGYDYRPVQQGDADEGQRGDLAPRRHEPMALDSTTVASSSTAGGRGNARSNRGPNDEEIHPALRDDPDLISHAL